MRWEPSEIVERGRKPHAALQTVSNWAHYESCCKVAYGIGSCSLYASGSSYHCAEFGLHLEYMTVENRTKMSGAWRMASGKIVHDATR